ncbi:MAG: NUDIX hydrolase [Lactobacillales bacterium]|jgi:ADP-ribose pyrophosphatase|nr:NUDIX hydrolase [Lactobacillales bacterium]
MKDKFEEVTTHRETIFEGRIFTVAVDDVDLPNGGVSKRELVFHKGAVGAVVFTPEKKLVLVKQYRKAIERVSLEIPAGKLEVGENADLAGAMARELEEETAYRAVDLVRVASMYSAIGFCNELVHVYYSKNLERVENPRPMDDDEVIEVYELTLAEALAEVESGLICDAKTLYAVQLFELLTLKGEL